MSEMWMRFQQGAGIGAWVIGAGLVLVVALPVFGLLFAVIGWILRGGKRKDDDL